MNKTTVGDGVYPLATKDLEYFRQKAQTCFGCGQLLENHEGHRWYCKKIKGPVDPKETFYCRFKEVK